MANASAQSTGQVTLGVLTDMSSVYADSAGKGSVAAVQLAIEDVGGKALGQPVKLVSADYQMKTDVALSIAREWFDRDGVDAIFDVVNSGTALAINNLVKDKKKLAFITAAAADQIGGTECNGYGIGFLYNFTSIVKTVVQAQLAKGYKTWFLMLPDAAYGDLMNAAIRRELTAGGGQIVGSVRFPFETQDFSSYLLQAKASGAQLIVSTSGGAANINIMKQAREFGLPSKTQKVGGMIDILTDVKSAGLRVMQGQEYATSFYWNMDDRTRAFAKRFYAKMGKMPTNNQAGGYSAALQYLKAVNAIGSKDPQKVFAYLKTIKFDDAVTRHGTLRPGGRLVRDMYLVRAKKPEDQKGDWDYYDVVATIGPEQAFGPLSESRCAMDK
ncbi:ABC transporter substrate-binding protein [Paraburkholderia xenovorans]|nr:ABC transporter substrate-binding protein [Paraburkholderia xenovorans]